VKLGISGSCLYIILATQEQRSGGSRFEISTDKWFSRPYLENSLHKKGLVEWLKVKALSSNPGTTIKKENWGERLVCLGD
jgi:hypothetical protein